MTDATQLDLMPVQALAVQACCPPLDLLPPDDQLPSPPPSKDLVESIRTIGVIEPITVAFNTRPDGAEYVVIDGRRRVKAARMAGLTRIPATHIADLGEQTIPALTVHAHATRSANPLADLAAIQQMVVTLTEDGWLGKPEMISVIAKATGLAVGTVKQRIGLLSLAVKWIDAVKAGKITIGIAERLAKLPTERRANLWAVFEANGRLTAADLKAEVSKGASAAAEQFDWDQIDGVPSAASDPIPFEVLEGIRIALSERFVDWSMDESTGTFVVSVPSGNYRLKVVRE